MSEQILWLYEKVYRNPIESLIIEFKKTIDETIEFNIDEIYKWNKYFRNFRTSM